jgi:hypothetical protein
MFYAHASLCGRWTLDFERGKEDGIEWDGMIMDERCEWDQMKSPKKMKQECAVRECILFLSLDPTDLQLYIPVHIYLHSISFIQT